MPTTDKLNKIVHKGAKLSSGLKKVMDTDLDFFSTRNRMSIDRIKHRSKGYAKTNKFYLTMSAPKTISQYYNSTKLLLVSSLLKSAALPSISYGTFEHRSKGPVRKLPNDVIYSDITLIFMVDNAMVVRKFFQDWLNSITTNNHASFNYLDDYSTNLQISIVDNEWNEPYTIEFVDAFPINMGEIAISSDSNDNIMEQSVTFSYYSWNTIDPLTNKDNTIGGKLNSLTGGLSKQGMDILGTTENASRKLPS